MSTHKLASTGFLWALPEFRSTRRRPFRVRLRRRLSPPVVKAAARGLPVKSRVELLIGEYYFQAGKAERAFYIFKGLGESLSGEQAARASLRGAEALVLLERKGEALDEYLRVSFGFPDFPDLVRQAREAAYALALELGRKQEAESLKRQLGE